MDTENLKIKTYSTAIKNLPDYPSDAGYTAAMLKEAFDARSDNEIKEKHNALVDAVKEELAQLKSADSAALQSAKKHTDDGVSAHNTAEDSHSDIRSRLLEIGSEITESKTYADRLIENLEEELGVMESDTGTSEKKVRRANTAFYADEAAIANQASKDGDGKKISTTYATKAELETAVGDISSALDELHAYAEALIGGEE